MRSGYKISVQGQGHSPTPLSLTLGTFRAPPCLFISSMQCLEWTDLGLHPGSPVTVTLAVLESPGDSVSPAVLE